MALRGYTPVSHTVSKLRTLSILGKCKNTVLLKGHGNEGDFLGLLHKSVPHETFTLPFEPFRFWLRIRGDIRNRKTTPRLAESGSRQDFLELPFFQTFK